VKVGLSKWILSLAVFGRFYYALLTWSSQPLDCSFFQSAFLILLIFYISQFSLLRRYVVSFCERAFSAVGTQLPTTLISRCFSQTAALQWAVWTRVATTNVVKLRLFYLYKIWGFHGD
jgi:hypothetical protein